MTYLIVKLRVVVTLQPGPDGADGLRENPDEPQVYFKFQATYRFVIKYNNLGFKIYRYHNFSVCRVSEYMTGYFVDYIAITDNISYELNLWSLALTSVLCSVSDFYCYTIHS